MKTSGLRAYGLNVQAAFELPVESEGEASGGPQLRLALTAPETLQARWSHGYGPPEWQTRFPNGAHVRWERGSAGDYLLTFGRRACFHLDRRHETMLCAPTGGDRLDWQRFLLDTALPCVSSIAGFEALHASAVDCGQGVVAFVASSGGGKSSLAAELVIRGQALVCDDVLALGRHKGTLFAYPGPPLMTLASDVLERRQPGRRIGGESEDGRFWVRVPRESRRPAPLAAVFVLEHHRSDRPRLVRESARPGRLLPHMLSLSRDSARALSRLGLLRELAASVPVYRVGMPAGGIDGLADLVEATIGSTAPAAETAINHASAA